MPVIDQELVEISARTAIQCSVVLVAYELPGEENLGARYVLQALTKADFPAAMVTLNTLSEPTSVANSVLARAPSLIGLSMSDNQVAIPQLALAALLRARGYEGCIVAGGALATVARHELLAKHEALDGIIRHQGEGPMVALARALCAARSIDEVPGLTTRAGDGQAHVDFDVTPVSRPFRQVFHTVLGMRVARVMASRGCNGGCSYCGSTAVRRDLVQEARRADLTLEVIEQQRLASQRVRPLADFADEIAELYHEREVRFFRLIDDHILGPDADAALKWLSSLDGALRSRRVTNAAFSLMVEPSVVTDAVADAMRELGIVRVLVGIESLTQGGLRALGRDPRLLGENREVVRRLRDRGMAVFHNSIFLHPDSTPETIRDELSGLPFVSGVSFDALPLLVFPGTGLYSRLQRDGRLLGGMLGCDYSIRHPVVSLMRSLIHGLRRELPELPALSHAGFELDSLYALSERCSGKRISARLRQELRTLLDRIGELRTLVLTELLHIAENTIESGGHVQRLRDLVGATQPRMLALSQQLEVHRERLEGQAPNPSARIFRSTLFAAGLVAIGPGCGGAVEESTGSGGTTGGTVTGNGGTTGGTVTGNGGVVTRSGTVTGRGGTAGGTVTGSGGVVTTMTVAASGGSASNYLSTSCNAMTLNAISRRLDTLASASCNSPTYNCDEYRLRIDASGQVVDVLPSTGVAAPVLDEAARACVIQVLSQERYPCLTDGFAWRHYDCLLL